MMLVTEAADLLVEATLVAVFGIRCLAKEVPYLYKGQPCPGIGLGTSIKGFGNDTLNRIFHPLRMMFGAFDYIDLNQKERENSTNMEAFKAVVADMIRERRAELDDPACATKTTHVDFLS